AGRGRQAGFRALHAHGAVFRGTFTPNGALAPLTRAPHLTSTPSEVHIRFSNGSADPTAPDTDPGVRGMVVRFERDGQPMHDLVAATFRTLGTRDVTGFVELTEVLGKVDPRASGIRRAVAMPMTIARFMAFARRHPESRSSMREFQSRRPEASYATTRFDGANAYLAVDAAGSRTPFRYRWVPDAGEAWLTKDEARARMPQFLLPELEERLTHGPVGFHLIFQLAEQGDPTSDPSIAWPETRRLVDAGSLLVRDLAPDSAELDRQGVFDPTLVPDGIELSDDATLVARGEIYRLAGERRRAGR
ncbi:MAG: hypothetical protein A2Z32_12285, partial [Chloroflexi bacterium RBG_16_69_14]